MDDFDKMYTAMGAKQASSSVLNADGSVPENIKKEYWKRVSMLIIQHKSEVVQVMNSSGIAHPAGASDEELVKNISMGLANKNLKLVHGIAGLIMKYYKN